MSEAKLQERLRAPVPTHVVGTMPRSGVSVVEPNWELVEQERIEAADALDAAELIHKSDVTLIEQLTLQRDGWKERYHVSETLNNMLLLCGEPELDGLNEPAARLRALIDGLITQRNRADAAEAEIARLKAIVAGVTKHIPMDYLRKHDAPGATGPTPRLDLVAAVADYSEARWRLVERLRKAETAAQPPAVGEDVVEQINRIAGRLNILASGMGAETQTELSTTMAHYAGEIADDFNLLRFSLLRTKDAG